MGRTIAIGAVAVVVAFGAAFAIGKATAPKAEVAKAAAPTPVQSYKVAATTVALTSYTASGSLPAAKKEKKKAKKKKKSKKRVRRLFGNAKGSFRTSGRNAAATVRGTRWSARSVSAPPNTGAPTRRWMFLP